MRHPRRRGHLAHRGAGPPDHRGRRAAGGGAPPAHAGHALGPGRALGSAGADRPRHPRRRRLRPGHRILQAVVGAQTAGRVGFFLRVDDFDAAHRRLVDAGVEFLRPPRAEPYGRVAVFRDIAGNPWDLLGP
ncbi:VOC family protein [Micromonospora harpali]|uniref:VOC family protein n=1 Tax=Micromonospora harpali TaxID=1490225 RepID=A0ABW1HPJ8_9ACTN